MGFDVLAWEGGFFDCEEMNQAIRSEMPIQQAIRRGLHPISAQSGLLVPLFNYIRSTVGTDRPLLQTVSIFRIFSVIRGIPGHRSDGCSAASTLSDPTLRPQQTVPRSKRSSTLPSGT